jgi:L-ascorbate metabolism protein UlaG (beta-lactamase superfamily)
LRVRFSIMTSKLFRRLLDPVPECVPDEPDGRIRFLGTAGFEIVAADGQTLLLDPNFTRPGLIRSAFGRLDPNKELLAKEVPKADAVLCGHSHHDHALDAPAICEQTGALLVGSTSTRNLGRAAGLPEAQMVVIEESTSGSADLPSSSVGSIAIGETVASALPSRHGKAIFGRVPLPGDIAEPPHWPPRMWDMRHGDVYTWHLDVGDATILHVDSADWIDETLQDIEVDILLLCAVGRQYRQNYTRGIVTAVKPKVVIPCHWDDFTAPWGAVPHQLPGCKVAEFCEEIQECGSEPIMMGFGNRWSW